MTIFANKRFCNSDTVFIGSKDSISYGDFSSALKVSVVDSEHDLLCIANGDWDFFCYRVVSKLFFSMWTDLVIPRPKITQS